MSHDDDDDDEQHAICDLSDMHDELFVLNSSGPDTSIRAYR